MAASASLGAVVAIAASHHGALTRRQAAGLGLKPNAISSLIRRGVLEEPAPGLLVVAGSPSTFDRLAHSASLIAGDRGVLAGATSAWYLGVDGLARPAEVEVLTRKGIRLVTGSLPITVRGCRDGIDDDDVIQLDGMRMTGLARTICDLAGRPDAPPVDRLVDDLERRNVSLTWLRRTAERLQAKGRVGPGQVLGEIERRAVMRSRGEQVRGSWFQKLVAECLASPLLPGLVEEYVIRDEAGRFVARCDVAVPVVRLGIEAHSRRHHFGPAAEAYDEQRDNLAAEAGWLLRYVTWADRQRNPAVVRAYFERLVQRRARDLGIDLGTVAAPGRVSSRP